MSGPIWDESPEAARYLRRAAPRPIEAAPALHYFSRAEADPADSQLGMAKMQGYVPQGCLLSGVVVMSEVTAGRSPCWGCEGPRARCGGKPKRGES